MGICHRSLNKTSIRMEPYPMGYLITITQYVECATGKDPVLKRAETEKRLVCDVTAQSDYVCLLSYVR